MSHEAAAPPPPPPADEQKPAFQPLAEGTNSDSRPSWEPAHADVVTEAGPGQNSGRAAGDAAADASRIWQHIKFTEDRKWFWSDKDVTPELADYLLSTADFDLQERPRNFSRVEYPPDMCALLHSHSACLALPLLRLCGCQLWWRFYVDLDHLAGCFVV